MTEEYFINHVDGLINDYTDGAINGRDFRSGLLDILLTVARPHLEPEPAPIFSTLTTMSQFREALLKIKRVEQLNELRDVIRKYNRDKTEHPLRTERFGFSTLFKALDNHADELGFIKYSYGYRQPSNTN